MSEEFEPIPNPYTSDQVVAGVILGEVLAALKVGSILAPVPTDQVQALFSWVRILGQFNRERTMAMIWEMCNAALLHVQSDIALPVQTPVTTCDPECKVNHEERAEYYNLFLKAATAGDYQGVVDMARTIEDDQIYDVLGEWMCEMSDAIAAVRFTS